MKQWKVHIVFSLMIILMGMSCAQLGRPEGGDEDEDAPEVMTEGSTPNMQTRFTDRAIELQFNEWITVSNPVKEIFVSPPLDYPLKISDRGKTVKVEFNENEILKENTTYQINFGKAIKDLTAGNELENYTFLFSTGDEIDQLSINGIVKDAMTGKGVSDVVICLYDNLSDTCFETIKPLYLTRTDKDGSFELQNLREDTFQIFALMDENVSYTYDQQTEQVAYLDSFLILNEVDSLSNIVLELFDEEDEPRLLDARQRTQGLVKVVYLPMPEKMTMSFMDSTNRRFFLEPRKDTFYLWHDDLDLDSAKVVAVYPQGRDTFKFKAAKKSIEKMQLLCESRQLTQDKEDTIFIDWNKPLSEIDTAKISIQDTSMTYAITSYGVQGKQLWMQAELSSAQQYNIRIDSAAVTDWYGQDNKDSLGLILRTIDRETLGNIKLTIIKEDSLAYLIEVISKDKLVAEYTIVEQQEISLSKMQGGDYSLKITQDKNGDGRWSSGSIRERRRPEQIEELTLEKLKAGWDLEADVDLTELFYGT